MTRRFAVLVGALVAAAALSSCTTFDNKDLAATVNGVELSVDTLNSMLDEKSDQVEQALASPLSQNEPQERTALSTDPGPGGNRREGGNHHARRPAGSC